MTCELLQAIRLSSTGLVVAITELSCGQVSSNSENLPILLALCLMLLHTYYAQFNAGIIRTSLVSTGTNSLISRLPRFLCLLFTRRSGRVLKMGLGSSSHWHTHISTCACIHTRKCMCTGIHTHTRAHTHT